LIKVVICLALLTYASISDYKSREVSDKIWMFSYPLGLAISLYEALFIYGYKHLIMLGLSVISSSLLGFPLLYFGLFGGADVKALIMISLFFTKNSAIINLGVMPILSIFPISVFINSLLLSLIFPISLLFRNILWALNGGTLFENGLYKEPLWKRVITLISCIKVRVEDFKGPPFQYLAEKVTERGGVLVRELRVSLRLEDEDYLECLRGMPLKEVWVTPTLPFIVFITLGFVVSIFFGNPLLFLFM